MSENDTENKGIDIASLKNEIIESNKSLMEGLKDTILSQVNQTLESHAESIKNSRPTDYGTITTGALDEFKEELEEIGIDEKQGKAMVSMVEKLLKKNTSTFKTDVLKEVDQNINSKELARNITQSTLRMFPDAGDPSSELFKTAKKMWKEMSDVSKTAPDAELIAVEKAALRLGVRPRTIRDVSMWDAQNPTDGEGNPIKSKKREISADTAKLFNVDPKKVAEVLKSKGY